MEQYKKIETYEYGRNISNYFAAALIIIGIIVALWAIINTYKIFTNPEEIEVFREIVPHHTEARTLEMDGKKILIPVSVFYFMAFAIGCFLLFIAGSIGASLIKSGVNLLQTSIRR